MGMLRALQQIGKVEVAIFADSDNLHPSIPEWLHDTKVSRVLEMKLRPNEGWAAKLRFTFDPRTDYPYGRGVSYEVMRSICRDLEEFDLIWFFKQRAGDMFPNMKWQRSVMDIDDLQSTYERTILLTGGPMARLRALRGQYIWRRREKLLGNRFDVLTVCSEQDRDWLRQLGVSVPIHVVPNGFDKPLVEAIRIPANPPRLGFIGGFDHLPNREGMEWFLSQCWPSIKREVPNLRLRLIGLDSNKYSELSGVDVDQLGSLADPSSEMKTWAAMVVPIRLGAGTRIKIAHGFSQRCPIVSTSFGAFGYGALHGRNMYLADSADAFSNACVKSIRDPEGAAQMAERAWAEFLEKWTWEAIRPRVWAAAEECFRHNVR